MIVTLFMPSLFCDISKEFIKTLKKKERKKEACLACHVSFFYVFIKHEVAE